MTLTRMRPAVADDPVFVGPFSKNSVGLSVFRYGHAAPSSGTYAAINRIHYAPFYIAKQYSLARWWWLNGATVGTNYVEAGIYDQDFNLFKASPRTLSAGTASQIQYATPGIHGTNVMSGTDTTDGTVFTTASVTMKAGLLYLLAVENSKSSGADAPSSIDSATGGYPTFTSRSGTVYSTSNGNYLSIWSAVPTEDFTGTLRINFPATETGAIWSLNAFLHVDTATNDGIVQNATGTGTGTTTLATLSAFSSANNATFGAFGIGANAIGTPESAAYVELSDDGMSTPNQAMHCDFRPDNDTTVSSTISSFPWAACAVEIKSLGTDAITIPPMRGYLAIHCNGVTATFFRNTANLLSEPHLYQQSSATAGLPLSATPAGASTTIYETGFTSRASP